MTTKLKKPLRRIICLGDVEQSTSLPRALVVTLTPEGLVKVRAWHRQAKRSEVTFDLVKFFGTVGLGQLFVVGRPTTTNVHANIQSNQASAGLRAEQ